MPVQRQAGLAQATGIGIVFHNEDINRRYVGDAGHLVLIEILLLGKAIFKSDFMYGGCTRRHRNRAFTCALMMSGITYQPQCIKVYFR